MSQGLTSVSLDSTRSRLWLIDVFVDGSHVCVPWFNQTSSVVYWYVRWWLYITFSVIKWILFASNHPGRWYCLHFCPHELRSRGEASQNCLIWRHWVSAQNCRFTRSEVCLSIEKGDFIYLIEIYCKTTCYWLQSYKCSLCLKESIIQKPLRLFVR